MLRPEVFPPVASSFLGFPSVVSKCSGTQTPPSDPWTNLTPFSLSSVLPALCGLGALSGIGPLQSPSILGGATMPVNVLSFVCACFFKVCNCFLKANESSTSYFTITGRHNFFLKYVERKVLARLMDLSSKSHLKRTIYC